MGTNKPPRRQPMDMQDVDKLCAALGMKDRPAWNRGTATFIRDCEIDGYYILMVQQTAGGAWSLKLLRTNDSLALAEGWADDPITLDHASAAVGMIQTYADKIESWSDAEVLQHFRKVLDVVVAGS